MNRAQRRNHVRAWLLLAPLAAAALIWALLARAPEPIQPAPEPPAGEDRGAP